MLQQNLWMGSNIKQSPVLEERSPQLQNLNLLLSLYLESEGTSKVLLACEVMRNSKVWWDL